MKEIPITKGLVVLVDDEDFERVNQWKWQADRKHKWSKTLYAKRTYGNGSKKKSISMHHFIMGKNIQLDHKNGNGLDNQKHNLRPANGTQNNANRPKFTKTVTSKFKGVCLDKRYSKWRSSIRCHGKLTCLGYWKSETDAAIAYNKAAIVIFGEFAKLNEI